MNDRKMDYLGVLELSCAVSHLCPRFGLWHDACNVADFKYPESITSRLFERYFPRSKVSVSKVHFVQRFEIREWLNNQDVVQMLILYFIHSFLISQLGDLVIPIDDFLMVEDGRYKKFSWDQLALNKLMKSMRQDFRKEKTFYRLDGMPYAINVWIY